MRDALSNSIERLRVPVINQMPNDAKIGKGVNVGGAECPGQWVGW